VTQGKEGSVERSMEIARASNFDSFENGQVAQQRPNSIWRRGASQVAEQHSDWLLLIEQHEVGPLDDSTEGFVGASVNSNLGHQPGWRKADLLNVGVN